MVDAVESKPFPRMDGLVGVTVYERAKRVLDLGLAVLAIVFLAPLLLVITAAVWFQDGGPILFLHTRLGRGGKPFKCLKFRSMAVDAQARLEAYLERNPKAQAEWARDRKLRQDPRVTPVGRFLRRSSLDELPQLFNVLRGDMSLVGPRPIVEAEAAKYGGCFQYYCAVRPGITGLWQVSGRNDVSYDVRVALDTEYVRSIGLWSDLRIIALTIPAILMRRGSY